MEISSSLKCGVEEGKYGTFVRLSRGTRWIVFSKFTWKMIKDNIPKIEQPNAHIKLTEDKEVTNVTFKDRRYISFHRISKVQGKVYDTYINLNEEEWTMFKTLSYPCLQCHDKTDRKQMFDGCLHETLLTPKQLEDAKENNKTANNQLAYQCEYCGVNFDYGACHCHRYNCHECEPDNVCSLCDKVIIESA